MLRDSWFGMLQQRFFKPLPDTKIRVLAQLELDFNSVERIGEYSDAPQEAPTIIEDKRPPASWPSSSGCLEVKDLVIRYAQNLPAVLNGISLSVKPGEKIGVVSPFLCLEFTQLKFDGYRWGEQGQVRVALLHLEDVHNPSQENQRLHYHYSAWWSPARAK